MPAISNQATLRTAIADWLNRSDLTNSQIDQFIELGEAMIYEALRVPPLEAQQVFSVSESNSSIIIPSGYLSVISLIYRGDGTCSINPTVNTTRAACTVAGGTWLDSDKEDDITYRRVDARAFYNTKISYAYIRERGNFLLTNKDGEQKASGEFVLKFYKTDSPIGTVVGGTEVYPYILQQYELILYAALAFGSSFLNDAEAEARYLKLASDKIEKLNSKAASAELKGGDYVQGFSCNLI